MTESIRLSISSLAQHLKMDRRTISKRLEGVETDGAKGGKPVYPLGPAVRAIFDISDAAEADELRHRNLKAKTIKAEVEAEIITDKVVDRSEIENEIFTAWREHRDALETFFAQTGPDVASEIGVDPVKLTTAFETRVKTFLEERAHEFGS